VDIQIFPNPASTQCNIHVRSYKSTSDYILKILDSRGVTIRNLDVAGADVHYILDLQDWPPGAYFVQLIDQAGRQLTRKFIVLD
jgi:hypothetical protein